MKIAVIGSLGNVGKILVTKLVAAGHEVTAMDYREENTEQIRGLGAIPAIGSLDDIEYLNECFQNMDAIFTMYPPLNYLDPNLDVVDFYTTRTRKYTRAIINAKTIKRVVNLSSLGAHLKDGNGAIKGVFYLEQIFNDLPQGICVTQLRAGTLYTNIYGYINSIKSDHTIYASFGNKSTPWTSYRDIADAAFDELISINPPNRTIRYVASENLKGDEVAKILGNALNMPDLKWQIISDEKMLEKLSLAGISKSVAADITEMYAALNSGLLAEDYWKNNTNLGHHQLAAFAKEIATVHF